MDSNLQRAKARGVVSHFVAQRQRLTDWLQGCGEGKRLCHAIVVRIFDDTNVWTAPGRHSSTDPAGAEPLEPAEEEENPPGDDVGKNSGKQGRRKVSPLLGIIQKVFARKQDSEVDFARVHVPSQVLPKAVCGQSCFLIKPRKL